ESAQKLIDFASHGQNSEAVVPAEDWRLRTAEKFGISGDVGEVELGRHAVDGNQSAIERLVRHIGPRLGVAVAEPSHHSVVTEPRHVPVVAVTPEASDCVVQAPGACDLRRRLVVAECESAESCTAHKRDEHLASTHRKVSYVLVAWPVHCVSNSTF